MDFCEFFEVEPTPEQMQRPVPHLSSSHPVDTQMPPELSNEHDMSSSNYSSITSSARSRSSFDSAYIPADLPASHHVGDTGFEPLFSVPSLPAEQGVGHYHHTMAGDHLQSGLPHMAHQHAHGSMDMFMTDQPMIHSTHTHHVSPSSSDLHRTGAQSTTMAGNVPIMIKLGQHDITQQQFYDHHQQQQHQQQQHQQHQHQQPSTSKHSGLSFEAVKQKAQTKVEHIRRTCHLSPSHGPSTSTPRSGSVLGSKRKQDSSPSYNGAMSRFSPQVQPGSKMAGESKGSKAGLAELQFGSIPEMFRSGELSPEVLRYIQTKASFGSGQIALSPTEAQALVKEITKLQKRRESASTTDAPMESVAQPGDTGSGNSSPQSSSRTESPSLSTHHAMATPSSMDHLDPEMKQEARKERNREIARKARQRKKAYMQSLEDRLRQLESMQQQSQQSMQHLTSENMQLRNHAQLLTSQMQHLAQENAMLRNHVDLLTTVSNRQCTTSTNAMTTSGSVNTANVDGVEL